MSFPLLLLETGTILPVIREITLIKRRMILEANCKCVVGLLSNYTTETIITDHSFLPRLLNQKQFSFFYFRKLFKVK